MHGLEREAEEVTTEPILNTWEIITVESESMEIQLNLSDPISVSAIDGSDVIFVQLNMSEYKSENGQGLPESVVKWRDIPCQMASQAQADTVAAQGETGVRSAQTATSLNFIISLLLAGSMTLIWSMIELLQVVV